MVYRFESHFFLFYGQAEAVKGVLAEINVLCLKQLTGEGTVVVRRVIKGHLKANRLKTINFPSCRKSFSLLFMFKANTLK